MKNCLTSMVFEDVYPSGNKDVWIYRYKNPNTGKGAYVIWCPTSDGTTVNDYILPLTEKVQLATKVLLVDKEVNGLKSDCSINNHTLTIDVSEKPQFILVDTL
jgi:hypothetical protein